MPPIGFIDDDDEHLGVLGFRLTRASVENTTLTLTYSENLDDTSVPAVGDFTVTYGTTDQTPTAVAISGAEVTLTVTEPDASEDVVVSYTPGTDKIQNTETPAVEAEALVNRRVTNLETQTFTFRLSNITLFLGLFDKAYDTTDNNNGEWLIDVSGSTPSNLTGPGTNSETPYAFSEMSGSHDAATKSAQSIITFNDDTADVATWLGGKRRKAEFELCAQGSNVRSFASVATAGFEVEGQPTGGDWERIAFINGWPYSNANDDGDWERIAFINGWPYSNANDDGDTITEHFTGTEHECSRDGGWILWEVDIPATYDQVRCRVRMESGIIGDGYRCDAALYQVKLTHGGV